MIKRLIQQEDMTVVQMYTPNTAHQVFKKPMLMVGPKGSHRLQYLMVNFNIPLWSVDKETGWKRFNTEKELQYTVKQVGLIDTISCKICILPTKAQMLL